MTLKCALSAGISDAKRHSLLIRAPGCPNFRLGRLRSGTLKDAALLSWNSWPRGAEVRQ